MSLLPQDLISEVTCKEPYEWKDTTEHEWEFSPSVMSGNGAQAFKVRALSPALTNIHACMPCASVMISAQDLSVHVQIVAYDFGIKHNILRRLASFGCKITVVPADYPASKVLEMNPDGIFLSNGPVSCPLMTPGITARVI